MGGKKKKESEGEGAGLYELCSTTKEKSGAPKLYSAEEENGFEIKKKQKKKHTHTVCCAGMSSWHESNKVFTTALLEQEAFKTFKKQVNYNLRQSLFNNKKRKVKLNLTITESVTQKCVTF